MTLSLWIIGPVLRFFFHQRLPKLDNRTWTKQLLLGPFSSRHHSSQKCLSRFCYQCWSELWLALWSRSSISSILCWSDPLFARSSKNIHREWQRGEARWTIISPSKDDFCERTTSGSITWCVPSSRSDPSDQCSSSTKYNELLHRSNKFMVANTGAKSNIMMFERLDSFRLRNFDGMKLCDVFWSSDQLLADDFEWCGYRCYFFDLISSLVHHIYGDSSPRTS
jgi:hypothetical protein